MVTIFNYLISSDTNPNVAILTADFYEIGDSQLTVDIRGCHAFGKRELFVPSHGYMLTVFYFRHLITVYMNSL